MSSPNFIDYVKFHSRSGQGGTGCLHFHRDKKNPRGGPDGGDGGRGGHIILRGNAQYWTLLHLRYHKHILAENGYPGSKQNKSGRNGKDVIIEVPLGTVVKKEKTSELVYEITTEGEQIILTQGGRGGKGNAFFANSVNRSPQHVQSGDPSIEEWITLELKILADVGLIGFPNAGKSTLLSSMSAAKPKISNYPFTTLTPNLGTVAYDYDKSFVMADIPGIIEGAAEGKGLGIRFLKHVERNSILLFLIASDTENIGSAYCMLLRELKQYNPKLLDKKRLLAISKSDLLNDSSADKVKQTIPKDIPSIFVSAVTHHGISDLKNVIWKKLDLSET